jgi:hypothetical protein
MADNSSAAGRRPRVRVRRVDECNTLDELLRHCFPAFGGAFLRRAYEILDRAIGQGCPLTVAVAMPALTIVDECRYALTGEGASIARGSQK